MMDRLIGRDLFGRPFILVKDADDDFEKLKRDALEKLARYEDIEEAGRLMILPKDYDKEKFKKENCPGVLGLKECCHEDADCDECWEAALKDGDDE